MSIYDASREYIDEGTPLLVLGGKEYGSGSSRDWAAKGTALLGVRAVLVESFERIHRSNLIGMGVLPLQFKPGESAESLGLTGQEIFNVEGIEELNSGIIPNEVVVTANGKRFNAIVRIDTPGEADYYRHGGIMQYVLRSLLAAHVDDAQRVRTEASRACYCCQMGWPTYRLTPWRRITTLNSPNWRRRFCARRSGHTTRATRGSGSPTRCSPPGTRTCSAAWRRPPHSRPSPALSRRRPARSPRRRGDSPPRASAGGRDRPARSGPHRGVQGHRGRAPAPPPVTLKRVFRLPSRLPGVRLPPRRNSRRWRARRRRWRALTRSPAGWGGTVGWSARRTRCPTADAADAAGRLGIRPRYLPFLWEYALTSGWFELRRLRRRQDRTCAVIGRTAWRWTDGDDLGALRVWAAVFATVLATALDVAADEDLSASRKLSLRRPGPGPGGDALPGPVDRADRGRRRGSGAR